MGTASTLKTSTFLCTTVREVSGADEVIAAVEVISPYIDILILPNSNTAAVGQKSVF